MNFIPERDSEGNPVLPVMGRFERTDIVLKLARASGQADANGDLIINVVIPGTPGEITRFASGGYAFVDVYEWESVMTKVEVVDVDNIFGYGAGVVLKEYHDSDVPTANQGWFFERSYGSEGNLDIEPMGWYGEMRGGLTLRMTFKIGANAKVKVLLYWGTKE